MPNPGLCRIEYEASAFGVELAHSTVDNGWERYRPLSCIIPTKKQPAHKARNFGRSSIRKMVHSRRHLQSWGMCTPRHIERRNPERCCQRWSPASAERCCKGNLGSRFLVPGAESRPGSRLVCPAEFDQGLPPEHPPLFPNGS